MVHSSRAVFKHINILMSMIIVLLFVMTGVNLIPVSVMANEYHVTPAIATFSNSEVETSVPPNMLNTNENLTRNAQESSVPVENANISDSNSGSHSIGTNLDTSEPGLVAQQSSIVGSFTVTYDLEYGNAAFVAFQHLTYSGQIEKVSGPRYVVTSVQGNCVFNTGSASPDRAIIDLNNDGTITLFVYPNIIGSHCSWPQGGVTTVPVTSQNGVIRSTGGGPLLCVVSPGEFCNHSISWDITLPGNSPPIVDAGSDQIVRPGETVQLKATASDPEEDPMTFEWTQLETNPDTSVILSSPESLSSTFTAPNVPGAVLTFQFAANDGVNSAVTITHVTIDANRPPISDAGPDKATRFHGGIVDTAFPYGCLSYDPDLDQLEYLWSQTVTNPSVKVTITDPMQCNPSLIFQFDPTAPNPSSPIILTFQLAVSDGKVQSTDSVNVVICPEQSVAYSAISSSEQAKCDFSKIEVKATHIGGILRNLPIWHLLVVTTNEDGTSKIGYRGGPGGPGVPGPFGSIVGTIGAYRPGFIDYDPASPTLTVLSGKAAHGKDTCFSSELSRIDAAHIPYRPLGPNSNSVAKTLLVNCQVPALKPVLIAPGWDRPPL
jgi:hypothetical protein